MSTADPNVVILTGENPFIRLSPTDSDDYTTNASFWRIIFSPGRTGARALSQERADREPLAHLVRQHRHGALAADDGAGHAQCGAAGYRRSP